MHERHQSSFTMAGYQCFHGILLQVYPIRSLASASFVITSLSIIYHSSTRHMQISTPFSISAARNLRMSPCLILDKSPFFQLFEHELQSHGCNRLPQKQRDHTLHFLFLGGRALALRADQRLRTHIKRFGAVVPVITIIFWILSRSLS